MLLQATIIRNYFVKTQTSVASFGSPDLSIIFRCDQHLYSWQCRSQSGTIFEIYEYKG